MNANDFSQPKQSIYKDCNSLTDDMNQSIENASTILDDDGNSEVGEVAVSNQMLVLLCCRRCLLNVYSNAVCLWELWAVFVVTTTTIAVIAFLVHTFPEYFETDNYCQFVRRCNILVHKKFEKERKKERAFLLWKRNGAGTRS